MNFDISFLKYIFLPITYDSYVEVNQEELVWFLNSYIIYIVFTIAGAICLYFALKLAKKRQLLYNSIDSKTLDLTIFSNIKLKRNQCFFENLIVSFFMIFGCLFIFNFIYNKINITNKLEQQFNITNDFYKQTKFDRYSFLQIYSCSQKIELIDTLTCKRIIAKYKSERKSEKQELLRETSDEKLKQQIDKRLNIFKNDN